MAKTSRTTRKKHSESFHHLISSLTYRASIGRSLLFAIILAPFFVYTFSSLQGVTVPEEAFMRSIGPLLATVITFFVYDFLFVSVAYYYPLKKRVDQMLLFVVELGILALLLLPLIWLELSTDLTKASTITLFATTPVFIFCLRVLIGVRGAQTKARR